MWYTSSQLDLIRRTIPKKDKTFFNSVNLMDLPHSKMNEQREAVYTGDGEYIAVLHSISDPDIFTEYALEAALAVVEAHAGSLFLWNEFQKEFVMAAARGPYRDCSSGARIKLREGILGWVGDLGQPVLVKNIHSDHRFQALTTNRHYRTYSFISLPLIANNKLLGILNLTEREDLEPFTEKDFVRAQKFAKHVAIAYENLRAAANLKKENEQLHRANAELRKSFQELERFVSIGKLAANLAHELNNPLDAIRRYVNLALDQAMENSLIREYLLNAKKGIRRSIQVIRGLLQFSKDSQQGHR
ncbi:MAG: GAF domain-containing protein, partial [Candidatus Omnitrophica bacterium]|nr:GAF domain-containing protein [Candidatus Omnitrophota bacterium]